MVEPYFAEFLRSLHKIFQIFLLFAKFMESFCIYFNGNLFTNGIKELFLIFKIF